MKNDLRIKRLKQLKYMLENHHKLFKTVKFDIDTWCSIKEMDDKIKDNTPANEIPKSCGTAACALGSAALYEPFRKEGLKIHCIVNADVIYRGAEGYDAGKKFFGITLNESENIFNPDFYMKSKVTPKDVAKKVIGLIAQYSA